MEKKIYVDIGARMTNPIEFNADICNGCNNCVEVCQVDLFIPNPLKGKPPIVLFPEECWYCGSCVDECPNDGAINLIPLKMNKVRWIESKK